MKVNDTPVKENTLDVIILDNVICHTYYDKKFDADDIQSPACYGLGREPKSMAPHAKAAKPQSNLCKGCWANEFDTNDRGGKACQQRQRLAVLSADFKMTAKTVEESQIYYVHVPVTSVRGFAVFTNKIDQLLKKHPMAFITTMELVPDERTQFKLTFEVKEEIKSSEVLRAILRKADEAEKTIMFAYPDYKEEGGRKRGEDKDKRRKPHPKPKPRAAAAERATERISSKY